MRTTLSAARNCPSPAVWLLVAWFGTVFGTACVDLTKPSNLPGGQSGSGGMAGAAGMPGTGGSAGRDAVVDPTPGDASDDSASNDAPLDGGGMPDAPVEVEPLLPLGAPCMAGPSCMSGNCADGVCCDTACTGTCQTCAAISTPGVCRPAAAGSDPRNDCPDEGANTCRRNGVCDGAGACDRYPDNTTCSPAVCSADGRISGGRCTGGSCVQMVIRDCAPFACTFTMMCYTYCVNNTICAAGRTCRNNVCQ